MKFIQIVKPMKKSLLVSFVIFLSVTGWFLSGQISIGNENSKNESGNLNISENNVSNNDEPSTDDLLAIIPNITSVSEFEVEVQEIIQLSVNAATIKPQPYVIIPTLGEKLDFTYSYPNNSRVIIRLFDL